MGRNVRLAEGSYISQRGAFDLRVRSLPAVASGAIVTPGVRGAQASRETVHPVNDSAKRVRVNGVAAVSGTAGDADSRRVELSLVGVR